MSPGQAQGAGFSQARAQQLLFTFLASPGDQEPAPALRRPPPPPHASLPPGRAHTHPLGSAAAAAAIKHPGTCFGSRRALAGRLMSNCRSAGVALKGPVRAGCRGCAGRPRGEEGRGCRPANRLDVPLHQEPVDGKGKWRGRPRVPEALLSKPPLFIFHLKFHFLSAQLEIILIVSWGSTRSKAPTPEKEGGTGWEDRDKKPSCSEKPAKVR